MRAMCPQIVAGVTTHAPRSAQLPRQPRAHCTDTTCLHEGGGCARPARDVGHNWVELGSVRVVLAAVRFFSPSANHFDTAASGPPNEQSRTYRAVAGRQQP